MASLARGIRLPGLGLRPLTARTEFTAVQSRFFSTSFRLRAAEPSVKTTRTPTPGRNIPKNASTSSSVAPSRYAFMKSLVTKTSPTILYESPSHFWFYFGCWSSGISILTWTALTAPTAMTQPEDVPQWVGYVFGASYVLLGSMGAYLITKTPNIVSRIRVLPVVQAATKTAPGTAAPALPPLHLEVTVKRMIPLLNPKIITTPLEKVSLKSRFSLPEEYVPELKRQEIQRAELSRRKAQRKFDMEHLMTMPFRQLGRAFMGMFNGIKSAWTDMGYGVIKVDGKSYKVDVTKGFAHDGFRTLEKLVDIKP